MENTAQPSRLGSAAALQAAASWGEQIYSQDESKAKEKLYCGSAGAL